MNTREKHISNTSMKIKQGKQNGVGGGKKHGVIRNLIYIENFPTVMELVLISNLSLQYINIAVLARD